MRNTLELTSDEARNYNFQPLLDSLASSKAIKDVNLKAAAKSETVNYKCYHNIYGSFAWRQFQIIKKGKLTMLKVWLGFLRFFDEGVFRLS